MSPSKVLGLVSLLMIVGKSQQSAQRPQPILVTGPGQTYVLDSTNGSSSILTFDYGHSVEGHPRFEVVSAKGDTSLFEMTYAECKIALESYMVSLPESRC